MSPENLPKRPPDAAGVWVLLKANPVDAVVAVAPNPPGLAPNSPPEVLAAGVPNAPVPAAEVVAPEINEK